MKVLKHYLVGYSLILLINACLLSFIFPKSNPLKTKKNTHLSIQKINNYFISNPTPLNYYKGN